MKLLHHNIFPLQHGSNNLWNKFTFHFCLFNEVYQVQFSSCILIHIHISSAFFGCNLTVFQLLESFVRKSNIKEICNFSNRWKCNYPPKHPPPVQLGPDEEEGVHPDVQPPVRVGGVQKPEALRQADSSLLELFCALGHILPMENTYIIL